MELQEKLEELEKKEWSDIDREEIAGWQSQLRAIRIEQEYLNLPQTQDIILFLKSQVIGIDEKLKSLSIVNIANLPEINNDIARKEAFKSLLDVFNVNDDFELQKKEIELKIDNALTL